MQAAIMPLEVGLYLAREHQLTVLADLLVHRLEAVPQLEALLAADVVPHATLMWGKSLVDESAPEFLGIYAGTSSQESVRRAIEDAPVLLTAGVQFTDMVSAIASIAMKPKMPTIVNATAWVLACLRARLVRMPMNFPFHRYGTL